MVEVFFLGLCACEVREERDGDKGVVATEDDVECFLRAEDAFELVEGLLEGGVGRGGVMDRW